MSDRTILNGWMQDWVHAGRLFRKQPGFALAIALTLALGLGVNATVLGMMDALLLRPYQFPDYQRIVVLWSSSKGTSDRQSVPPADYLDWRRLTSTVEHLVA